MKFPIVELYEDEEFSFTKSASLLRTTNTLTFKNKFFLDATIIDCTGKCFNIIDAKKVRNMYPFWKFEFFNRMIEMELVVEEAPDQITFTQLKSRLRRILRNLGSIAEADGQLAQRHAIIEKSESFRELIVDLESLEFYGTT